MGSDTNLELVIQKLEESFASSGSEELETIIDRLEQEIGLTADQKGMLTDLDTEAEDMVGTTALLLAVGKGRSTEEMARFLAEQNLASREGRAESTRFFARFYDAVYRLPRSAQRFISQLMKKNLS